MDVAERFETMSDSDTRHGTRLPLRACGRGDGLSAFISFLCTCFDLDDYDNDDEDQSFATVVRTVRRVGDIHRLPVMYRYLQLKNLDEQATKTAPPQ